MTTSITAIKKPPSRVPYSTPPMLPPLLRSTLLQPVLHEHIRRWPWCQQHKAATSMALRMVAGRNAPSAAAGSASACAPGSRWGAASAASASAADASNNALPPAWLCSASISSEPIPAVPVESRPPSQPLVNISSSEVVRYLVRCVHQLIVVR